jgi:hypothetical protein
MSYRQFIWGLSSGVIVLAISGAFWCGLAAWTAGLSIFLVSIVLIVACFAAIILAAVRLRRKAQGFKLSELMDADESKRTQTRKIVLGFRLVNIVQTVLIWLSALICFHFQRLDLIWPLIGLIVSLHLIPLARVFSVHIYYVAGVVGTGVSLTAILALEGSGRLLFLGLGMGLVVWLSAAYVIYNADRITTHALAKEKL